MSKLSFRARALDASKQMPIFMAEELPDLPEYSAINRAVPQMPSGMEKEEECEHHLQRAICAGLIIPTPEVSTADPEAYNRLYPADYKQPRQLIHMQPFAMEQDIPDYDMDSEDERWLVSQAKKLDLTPLKFEEMMDRLEKSSGQTVVTLNEAKALLKEDDDLIIAVFDYWLNKRLKTQHPLILSVKTEHRAGLAANNPYLAFRRRTEKMQTRKNRKNDETSYEKMLKLRRDLSRAVTLLELVKRREKTKREHLHLSVEIFEKRFQAQDFSGAVLAELATLRAARPAFTQLFQNHHYGGQAWANKAIVKDEVLPRKEKRQYKKRKHKNSAHGRAAAPPAPDGPAACSSDEEDALLLAPAAPLTPEPEDAATADEDGPFAFRRNKHCAYHMPLGGLGNWPWCARQDNGLADRRYRYALTSLAHPRRCLGFARRRLGRGGRVLLDRAATSLDDFWRQLDFTVSDGGEAREPAPLVAAPAPVSAVAAAPAAAPAATDEAGELLELFRDIRRNWLHFRPRTPPPSYEEAAGAALAAAAALSDELRLSSTVPITVELQNLASERPSLLLDDSLFTAAPFTLQELYDDTRQPPDSPHADTDPALDADGADSDGDSDNDIHSRTLFGCSEFRVADVCRTGLSDSARLDLSASATAAAATTAAAAAAPASSAAVPAATAPASRMAPLSVAAAPKKKSILSSTLTSPKCNSAGAAPHDAWPRQHTANHVSNGPLSTHPELASPNRKGNKMQHNAYTSGTWNARASYGAAASALGCDRNVRFATHTTVTTHTLNSHSANLLDITSLSGDAADPAKMNSQCADNNVASAAAAAAAAKQQSKQSIVRKNNSLVMEVT